MKIETGQLRHGALAWALALLTILPRGPLARADFVPVISEFMAVNQGGITDEDGDRPDWIEVTNVGDSVGNLAGWFLTDSSGDLRQWSFPDTPLAPGACLLVFASGKNRVASGAELHTNFKLGSEGEYLALIEPDGTTVASEFSPQYPAQLADVSYGIGMAASQTVFVSTGAVAQILIPGDDTLGTSWTAEGFVPDGAWSNAPAAVGFDVGGTPPAGLVAHWALDEAYGDAAIEDVSGNGHGGVVNGGTTLGVEGATVHTATAAAFANGSLDIPYDDALNPADFTVVAWVYPVSGSTDYRSVITSRRSSSGHFDGYILYATPANIWQFWTGDGGGWRMLDGPAVVFDAWTHLAISYNAATHTKQLFVNGEPVNTTSAQGYSRNASVDLHIGSGGDDGTQYRFSGRIDDVALFDRALDATAVQAVMNESVAESGTIDYTGCVATDLRAAMYDRCASAYLRLPFAIADVADVPNLQLNLRYDDGFVAYVNGRPVAAVNAPSLPRYDSTATARNPDAGAVLYEAFDLTSQRDVLHAGTNVLAIHGLNVASNNEDFLIGPELLGTTPAAPVPGQVGYFTSPSPGEANAAAVSEIGPWISGVGHVPAVPLATEPLLVTARVTRTFHAVGNVTLYYRAMYAAETAVPMTDAGAGVFRATIPAGAANPGDMLRYRIVAEDTATNAMTAPIFADRLGVKQSAEYFGTLVRDPAVSSDLPIFHWWTRNYAATHTRAGARVSVFYNGEFYDNVYARQRGQATNGNSQKFVFGNAHPFHANARLGRVREGNFNAQGVDASYTRQTLAFNLFAETGMPASESFLLWMRVNGAADRVGVFIEQVDDQFLGRHELDPRGALYKCVQKANLNPGLSEQPDGIEKKIPEDDTDFSDLQALIDGLALTDPAQRHTFMFDNFNLPEMISYLAVRAVLQDCDDVRKNFYMYRDGRDTGEWRIFPWDKDYTFGILGDGGTYATHPFLGDYVHRKQNANQWSRLLEAFYNEPVAREMFRRRTRTIMDAYLLPPGTPAGESWLEQRVAALFSSAAPHLGASATTAYNSILTYLPGKRTNLYVTHSATNLPADVAGIPDAQSGTPPIAFGAIEFNPASGNQNEEFVELINTNAVAVDISGWRLVGGAAFTFAPGTVVPAHTNLYLCRDVRAWRNRGTAPHGAMGLFAVGNYKGGLSNLGETLELRDAADTLVATTTYAGDPTPQQLALRVSELHFNPYPADTAHGEPSVTNSDFEFVELVNTSTNALDIGGVAFDEGLAFTVPSNTTLAAGARIVVAANPFAFAARYGAALTPLGPYTGRLDDGGEHLELRDAQGNRIQAFDFRDDVTPYADGYGPSLEIVDPAGDYEDAANWRDSALIGGTPGQPPLEAVRDVVINEVLTHTDPPETDSIELHNTSDRPVALGGWLLSDSAARYRKFAIPAGTAIPAGGYVVFDENDFNPTPLAPADGDFALDGAHGDDVWLVETDAAGRLRRIADSVAFGAARNGESFGRWPNATGALYPLARFTPGAANSNPRVGPMIVSEVMYHAPGDTNGSLEFVEVYNPADAPVSLAHWRLTEAARFAFPSNAVIAATGVVVIVGFDPAGEPDLADAFRVAYGIGHDVPLLGPFVGRLDNSGDTVRLLSADEPPLEEPDFYPALLEDEVCYGRAAPWPVSADGTGNSLNRLGTAYWGNDAASWSAAAPTPGTYAPASASGFERWRHTSFPPGTDQARQAWNADPNGNGRVNLLEYAFGFDPNGNADDDGSGFWLVAATPATIDVAYRRRIAASDLRYTLELSSDLAAWIPGDAFATMPGAPHPLGDGLTEQVTVRIDTDAAFGMRRGFVRLRVALLSAP